MVQIRYLPTFNLRGNLEQIFSALGEKFVCLTSALSLHHKKEMFKDEFNNWLDLPSFNDSLQAYVRFLEKFTILYNKCFPLKRKRARRQAIKKPWITAGL